MKQTGIKVSGVRLSGTKLEKCASYRLNVSARIAQKKSKKVRVTRRAPG